MPVESGLEAIVVLLYCPGSTNDFGEGIRGITRLDKLLYLLIKETAVGKPLEDEFRFEAYDYGPLSSEVYDAVEGLKDVGLISVQTEQYTSYDEISDVDVMDREVALDENAIVLKRKDVQIYRLSEAGMRAGRKLYDRLTPEEQESIRGIKRRFNSIPLRELIEYIYRKYPESAVRSRIRERILGESRFGSRPNMKPFVREEEDLRE
jgi:uncharacterized protein YwgA